MTYGVNRLTGLVEGMDTKLDRMETRMKRFHTELMDMKGELDTLKGQVHTKLNELSDNRLRLQINQEMGTSFSTKPFVISSLNDAIYLLSTANYDKLTPDASADQRRLAATSLAIKAQDYVVPLAKACLASFSVHYKAYVTWVARQAFEKKDYHKGVGLLLNRQRKIIKRRPCQTLSLWSYNDSSRPLSKRTNSPPWIPCYFRMAPDFCCWS